MKISWYFTLLNSRSLMIIKYTYFSNLTVMVWLFGGGFYSGSASLQLYDGKALSLLTNSVIININYRVGPFGYLYFNHEDAPGNIGMLDQVRSNNIFQNSSWRFLFKNF